MKIRKIPGFMSGGPNQRREREVRIASGWPENGTSLHWLRHAVGKAARGANVHVWTPPTETLLLSARLPTQSRAKISQALPYALEDQLLEEPERLHYAYVAENSGALSVAVTARVRFKAWIDGLAAAGVRPTSLCPANLALPLTPNAWSAAFIDDELWVRSGPYAGFACVTDVETPPPMLVTALKEAKTNQNAPSYITVFQPPPTFNADAWSSVLEFPVVSDPADLWSLPVAPPGLNLLQGDFSSTNELRSLVRPLWPAAVMLVIWLIGSIALNLIEWVQLRQAHAAYTAEMHEIFTQNFPEIKTVLDPATQMQRSLETLQSRGSAPGDLLSLLSRVAPTLQTNTRIKLQGIKYADHSLTLDLALPDYQTLEGIKNNFSAANLDVEVLAANSRGSEVDGRLRIQPIGWKAKSKSS